MDSIKDFIHYYYGQECMRAIIVPGQEPVFEKDPINARSLFELEQGLALIKPILRKLSSITEQEAIDIYTLERDNLLHPPTDDHDVRKTALGTIVVRLDLLDIHIHIGNEGQIYKTIQPIAGKSRFDELRNWPAIFHYLLKQGFWLFGQEAFEKGLIIEKK